ncbi:MAG: hypothetical protein KVP17_000734 [Porospora cf. gigantea B]|uniref:uncharacterized protein n=1 Tax=Porospora cf. gigantea B TaxID=2853592 RepID=UPI003571C540|nr:MAG: hypothetical protein KVP17_000734 [Porospora cf. gigantea B]
MTPQSTRQSTLSSRILHEEYVGAPPAARPVKYVDVPKYEQRVVHVPKVEVVEVEKRVPRIETRVEERVVEVPQVEYVERIVEVPQVEVQVRRVPKVQVVDVPRQVIREVPRIQTEIVEKRVVVPGEVIDVPKPYEVQNFVPVPEFTDHEVPVIVKETVVPEVVQGTHSVDLRVREWVPNPVEVEIPVAKLVESTCRSHGVVHEESRRTTVATAHYNAILKLLNPHIGEYEEHLPWKYEGGIIPILPLHEVTLKHPRDYVESYTTRTCQTGPSRRGASPRPTSTFLVPPKGPHV